MLIRHVVAVTVALVALGAGGGAARADLCTSCINIRISHPFVVRGPKAGEIDQPFNEIRLANGQRRGFTANQTTVAVTGADPWSMSADGVQTNLQPWAGGPDTSCGMWLNDTEKLSNTFVEGFVHVESNCNYAVGQTHKAMHYAWSGDEGLSWSQTTPIISGTTGPVSGKATGEGDCTVVNGQDGYYYAYCLRWWPTDDFGIIVARGQVGAGWLPWKKFYNGAWTEPGVGGNATRLNFFGHSAARWVDTNSIVLFGTSLAAGGVMMGISSDKTSFAGIADPLLPLDGELWTRPPDGPAPTELVGYLSAMNYTDVNNQISSPFILTHLWVQPNEGMDRRYLVFRNVYMWLSGAPVSPQVGLALTRWYNAANHDRWTTSGPVPGTFAAYGYEAALGYLMTRPHPTLPTVKLEECVSNWPGHPDHLLTGDGCPWYQKLRTAGWAYLSQQPGTVPLYRCYRSAEQHHFAATSWNCDGKGTVEWLLGYVLAG